MPSISFLSISLIVNNVLLIFKTWFSSGAPLHSPKTKPPIDSNSSDSNDVSQVTKSACDDSDVIYVPTDNIVANCTEAINNVALPTGTPIFAGEAGICAGCGVATLSIEYYDLGYQTGLMAYEILVNGANPGEMEIQFAPNVTKMYNATNAAELGIAIPADYVVIE